MSKWNFSALHGTIILLMYIVTEFWARLQPFSKQHYIYIYRMKKLWTNSHIAKQIIHPQNNQSSLECSTHKKFEKSFKHTMYSSVMKKGRSVRYLYFLRDSWAGIWWRVVYRNSLSPQMFPGSVSIDSLPTWALPSSSTPCFCGRDWPSLYLLTMWV